MKELHLKVLNEKEIKLGLLMDRLLEYVKERISAVKKDDDKDASQDPFIELLLKIFESKIFPLHKVNFMQFLPLYVIGLTNELSDNFYGQEKCRIFAEKLLSFLLCKAFNKNPSSSKREHISVRQHALNFLANILSRENEIIKPKVVVKCLRFVLSFFYTSKNEDE
jgi:RNA polymerase I specific transcription initiation factor RRN3